MGSWYGLLSILEEAAGYVEDEKNTPPLACPYDGEPLRSGPDDVLFCAWGNYMWPRDGRII